MASSVESLVRLLDECAKRLDESEAAIAHVRRTLEDARELAQSAMLNSGSPVQLRQVLNEHRGELIASVLAALNSGVDSAAQFPTRLAYDPVGNEFRLGRRKLDLTDSETAVLALLWAEAPAPVSRERLLAHLYPDGPRPADRVVDVFLSNLRRKMKLVSGGQTFIQSHRGRGWALTASEGEARSQMEEFPEARRQRG